MLNFLLRIPFKKKNFFFFFFFFKKYHNLRVKKIAIENYFFTYFYFFYSINIAKKSTPTKKRKNLAIHKFHRLNGGIF